MTSTDRLRDEIRAQKPTNEQGDAIFTPELEFILRAAPGSGKTWTSCRRFIWRAANRPDRAGGLALLSFTNVAINEFRTATIRLGRKDLLFDPNYVGTFDSFVERYILGPFGHLLTGADKRPRLFPGPRPGDRNNRTLQIWTTSSRAQPFRVWAWEVEPYLHGTRFRFKKYRTSRDLPCTRTKESVRALLSLGFYTHQQRSFWANMLLLERPHIAKLLARRFPEIIIDEAQDSNAWLLFLLNLLREKGAQVTLIGDPDQCIFEFNAADAMSLIDLKTKWGIREKPLSQSFRCNTQIAETVRTVGGNANFAGRADRANHWCHAFVVKTSPTSFSDCLAAFQHLTDQAGTIINSAAVISRGRAELESMRGKVNHTKLQGKAKRLAEAAFLRDSRYDYRGASQIVKGVVRELTGDDPRWERIDSDPKSHEGVAVSLEIWKFVKSSAQLFPLSELGCDWIPSVREQLEKLIKNIGLQCDTKLGHHIKTTGLSDAQKAMPLFELVPELPDLRYDTIHQVKGESIDAVLVIGSVRFWNSVVKAIRHGNNTEQRRLAYVAMTRARHLLVVGLQKEHYDMHLQTWTELGFNVVT